jgi:hypothetical protein
MKPIGVEKQRQKHRRKGREKRKGNKKNQTEKGGKALKN